jgi:hypothetical protein
MTKMETSDCFELKIWFLHRLRLFNNNAKVAVCWKDRRDEDQLTIGLLFQLTSRSKFSIKIINIDEYIPKVRKPTQYHVDLFTTPCYFGGKRWWFSCKFCGRRVGILYKPDQENYFACRVCYRLTYPSRKVSVNYRKHPLQALVLDHKISRLADKIKYPRYRGKITKKQRRLNQLEEKWNKLKN